MKIRISKRQKLCLISLIIVVVLIIAWLIAWNNGIRDYLYPKRWGVVKEGLVYRSGRLSPHLIEETLKKYKIKTIINLCSSSPKEQPEFEAAKKLGIKVYFFPMAGSGVGKPDQYVEALKTIVESTQNKKPVQIHCAAGSYRTGAVVALYQMLIEQDPPEIAYQEMRKYNYAPSTTTPYGMLLLYLNRHMKFIAEELVKQNVINSLPNPLPQLPVK